MFKRISGMAFLLVLAAAWAQAAAADTLPAGPSLKTVDYGLDLRVDYDQEKLFGDCRLTVVNESASRVDTIPLNLYRLMKVTAVKDAAGAPLRFSQDIRAFEDWERFQANFVQVYPAAPLPAGSRATIDILYEGYLGGLTETGMKYVKDRIDKDFTVIRLETLAYPVVGGPNFTANHAMGLQSFDYEISVTVPDSLVVANGGRLAGVTRDNGRATYAYRNILPAWRIDLPIANYETLEDAGQKLKVFFFPDDREGARRLLDALGRTVALYTSWFGPADPAAGLTVIEVPEGYGSQSDVTAILQTRDAFLDPGKLPELYHEVSHRWNVRALDPLPPRFESEGLAMTLQYLAQEKLDDKPGSLDRGAERLRDYFRRQCARNALARTTPIIDYGTRDLTDLSYSKGMLFFYALYKLAGEEDFLKTVGGFYQEYRDRGATAAEFISYLKARLGLPLDRFLQDWMFGTTSSDDLLGPASLAEIIGKYKPRT
jgi:hypothetical protein